jgi:methyltransferase
MTASLASLSAITFMLMFGETWLSSRHDRALRARRAVEPPGDVYRAMSVAYPGAFVAMFAEGLLRRSGPDAWLAAGTVVFAAAKMLKYWTIAALGPRWSFRVLVPPASTRIRTGPYRWIAHPNYLAVIGELVGIAIATHALVAGPVAVVAFGLLIRRRITIEETALGQR